MRRGVLMLLFKASCLEAIPVGCSAIRHNRPNDCRQVECLSLRVVAETLHLQLRLARSPRVSLSPCLLGAARPPLFLLPIVEIMKHSLPGSLLALVLGESLLPPRLCVNIVNLSHLVVRTLVLQVPE